MENGEHLFQHQDTICVEIFAAIDVIRSRKVNRNYDIQSNFLENKSNFIVSIVTLAGQAPLDAEISGADAVVRTIGSRIDPGLALKGWNNHRCERKFL